MIKLINKALEAVWKSLFACHCPLQKKRRNEIEAMGWRSMGCFNFLLDGCVPSEKIGLWWFYFFPSLSQWKGFFCLKDWIWGLVFSVLDSIIVRCLGEIGLFHLISQDKPLTRRYRLGELDLSLISVYTQYTEPAKWAEGCLHSKVRYVSDVLIKITDSKTRFHRSGSD